MGDILWPNGTDQPPNFSAEGHFGYRNSTAPGASKYHRGLDMWGIGTVRAIADGTVVAVQWAPHGWGGGYQVWIQHDGFFTRSLHLASGSSPVSVGQRVNAGDKIGVEGMTGAYQVHLHLEITPGAWHAGNYGQVDPKAWLEARVGTGSPAGIDEGASVPAITEEDDMTPEQEQKIDQAQNEARAAKDSANTTKSAVGRIETKELPKQREMLEVLGTELAKVKVQAGKDAHSLKRIEALLRAELNARGINAEQIASAVVEDKVDVAGVEAAFAEIDAKYADEPES